MTRSKAVTAGVSCSAQCEECGAEFTARADAVYCSDLCRVRAWRARKGEAQREASRLQHEHDLVRLVNDHHMRWTQFLRDNLPANSRVTDRHVEALYRLMVDRRMISGPLAELGRDE